MSRRQRFLSLITTAILGIAGLITAIPAQAVNTTPTDLYFPNTSADGSSCTGAPGQKWQDVSGNQLNAYTPGLVGANGYTVTIHNLCPGTIYIYYGETSPWDALATGQTATYTLTNSAAILAAYSGSALVGSTTLLASIYTVSPPDATATGSNASTTVSPTSISTSVGSTFILLNSGSDTLSVSGGTGTFRAGGQLCTVHSAISPCAINSSYSKVFTVVAQGTLRVGSTTITVGAGGGGGGASGASGSSASSVSAPQTLSVSLTPTDGTTCANSSQSATEGSWLTLPGANDCTPPKAKPGAKLLGWATSPNFPVALAQRQVNNGWAAYETFNSSGEISSVFIPAGGETFVTGSTSLYPIWAV